MTNLLNNKKTCKVIEVSKCIFLCIFTVYLLTREIYALNYFIDSFFITGFFMGMSLFYIGYDLLTKRFCFKTRYFPAALLFIIITVISCVINREYGVFSNLKGLAALVIYLFLLYPEAFRDQNSRTLSACFNTAYFTLTFYSLASIPMYIYNIDYSCYKGDIRKDQGFVERFNRLWGVFQDPNYLALFSLIALFSSILLFTRTKSVFKKIILVLFNLIHLVILSMTGSNMGLVVFIAALCWLSVIIAFKKLNVRIIYRILAFILALAISVSAPLVISKTINTVIMPTVKRTIIHSGGAETYKNVHLFYDKIYEMGHIRLDMGFTEEIDMSKFPFDELNTPIERIDRNQDASNGRFKRWIDGLKLIAEKPFFGISPRNILSFAEKAEADTSMEENDYTIHNTYLEILAGAGIIGALFILLFLGFAAIFVLKNTLKFVPDIKTIVSTCLIVIVTLSAFLLPDIIFFQLTFAGLTFWLSLGVCLNTNEENYKNSLSYKLLNKCFKRKTDI